MSGPGSDEEVLLSPYPRGTRRLQVKHGVQAIYEAGFALAEKPIERSGHAPRLYAGLFVQNQQIGFMKWQRKTFPLASTSTKSIDMANLTTRLQPRQGAEQTHSLRKTGTIVDPSNRKFTIKYKVSEQDIYYPEIFSTFLDALATAAPNDKSATDAYVNAVSHTGDTVMNIHGTGPRSTLTWLRLIEIVTALWSRIYQDHAHKEWDFTMFYDGVKFGEGWIMSIKAPSTSLASE